MCPVSAPSSPAPLQQEMEKEVGKPSRAPWIASLLIKCSFLAVETKLRNYKLYFDQESGYPKFQPNIYIKKVLITSIDPNLCIFLPWVLNPFFLPSKTLIFLFYYSYVPSNKKGVKISRTDTSLST